MEDQLEFFRLLQPYVHRSEDKRIKPHVVHPTGLNILDRLWVANLKLVRFVLRQRGPRVAREDAFQWGAIGLREGLLRFDPERGTKPSTYLAWWIRTYFRKAWDEDREIPIPEWVLQKKRQGEFTGDLPQVIGYHANNKSLHSDKGGFSPESHAIALEMFEIWRERLGNAEHYVHKKHAETEIVWFADVTGYAHPTQPPKPCQEIAVSHGVSRALVSLRVSQVMRTFAQACLMRREEFEPVFLAVIEYSLEKDLPL